MSRLALAMRRFAVAAALAGSHDESSTWVVVGAPGLSGIGCRSGGSYHGRAVLHHARAAGSCGHRLRAEALAAPARASRAASTERIDLDPSGQRRADGGVGFDRRRRCRPGHRLVHRRQVPTRVTGQGVLLADGKPQPIRCSPIVAGPGPRAAGESAAMSSMPTPRSPASSRWHRRPSRQHRDAHRRAVTDLVVISRRRMRWNPPSSTPPQRRGGGR